METNLRDLIVAVILTFAMPSVTWYIVRRVTSGLTKAIEELKERLDKYIEMLLLDYVRKTDYIEDQKAIKKTIERIFDKIENKVDKC